MPLPVPVSAALTWIENHALKDTDVISGKPAPMTLVKDLYKRAETEPLSENEDVRLVYGAFLLGLREMPDSLVPSSLYSGVLEIAKNAKAAQLGNVSSDQRARQRTVSSCSGGSDIEADMLQLKPYVSITAIAQLLYSMDSVSRQELGRIAGLLQNDHGASEDLRLTEIFAPLLFRRKNSAYMSVRHRADLSDLMLVLAVMIDKHNELASVYSGSEADIVSDAEALAASSTPSTTARRSAMQRAWSLSLLGTAPNPTTAPSSPISSVHETIVDSNGSVIHHVRRKTPPRINLDTFMKRRIEFDSIVSRVVDKIFILYDAGQTVVLQDERVIMEQQQSGAGNHASSVGSGAGQGGGGSTSGGTVWATKERVVAEKRVLKRRLLNWDKEFEKSVGRKPTKLDRTENRIVFLAYQAVKQLLSALEEDPPGPPEGERLLREKRALQALLKLHEKDFEDTHKRKVQGVDDIAGHELEYKRYRELKEMNVGST